MTYNEILKIINSNIFTDNQIIFPEEIIQFLSNEIINKLIQEFSGKYLFRLPNSEILFFEWLKNNDPAVWNDIWIDDDKIFDNDTFINDEHIEYTVSAVFLHILLDKDGRGFPICDLQFTDNYYFCMSNMVDEESEIIIETATELFRKNKKLTIAQLLALEISLAPIDIWHFAYKYKINLIEAKKAVEQLVDDGALVHLRERQHIAPFIK